MLTISSVTTDRNAAIPNFSVGQLVDVKSRTWPGINKHGGVGRIVRLSENCVDVHYVLGGRERGIPIEYVNLLPQAFSSRKSLRDRSILLGRCRTCGSLRADCGSCDFQEPTYHTYTKGRSWKRIQGTVTNRITIKDKLNNESTSSEESFLSDVKKWKRQKVDAKFKLDRLQQNIWDSSEESKNTSSENDSESSEDDDQYLKVLKSNARIHRNKILLNRLERTTRPKLHDHDKSINTLLASDSKGELQSRINISDDFVHETRGESNKSVSKFINAPNIAESRGDDIFEDTDALRLLDDTNTDMETLTENKSDLSIESHEEKERQVISYPKTVSMLEYQSGALLFENDLDGFIQPEGTANLAPRDREDKTLDIPFAELPQMFDETLQCVTVAFPEILSNWSNLQRRVDMRLAVGGLLSDLEIEGWKFYDAAREKLLFFGLDQCRYMFRRLNSHKEFRRHQDSLSKAQKSLFKGSARTLRDILFDKTEKDVEDFLREVRQYLHEININKNDDQDNKDDESQISNFSSDVLALDSTDQEMYQGMTMNHLPDFGTHIHARKRIVRESSKSVKQGRAKQHSRQKRKRNKVETSTGDVEGHQECSRNTASNASPSIRVDTFIENAGGVIEKPYDKKVVKQQYRFNVDEEFTSDVFLPLSLPLNAAKRNTTRALRGDSFQPKLQKNSMENNQIRNLSASTLTASRKNHEPVVDRLPLDENAFDCLRILDQDVIDDINVSEAITFIQSLCRSQTLEYAQIQRIKCLSHANFSNDDKRLIFSLIERYLTSNPETLQELVVTDYHRLSLHVDNLTRLLTLLDNKLYPQANSVEEDSFRLFSASNGIQPCPFVQLLILQVLDVLYAYSNKKSWAIENISSPIDIPTIISPLRDSLSSFLPLMEISCNYILERLACQEWYKCCSNAKWFVSSVNPNSYRLSLETGDLKHFNHGELY
jgi:hypothetical protein